MSTWLSIEHDASSASSRHATSSTSIWWPWHAATRHSLRVGRRAEGLRAHRSGRAPLPQQDVLVVRSGREHRAAVRPSHDGHDGRVVRENREQRARRRIVRRVLLWRVLLGRGAAQHARRPHAHRRVAAGRREARAIGMHVHRVHRARLALLAGMENERRLDQAHSRRPMPLRRSDCLRLPMRNVGSSECPREGRSQDFRQFANVASDPALSRRSRSSAAAPT